MKTTIALFLVLALFPVFGKDLEISIIHLDRHSVGGIVQMGFNQSISITNSSNKTIDLFDYSISNNGKEILRITEHIKLENGTKKEFRLSPVKDVKDDKFYPALDAWFGILKNEKDIQKEKENLDPIMKRYLPYMTEDSLKYYSDITLKHRYPYLFLEIALISPQKEVVDQILVTTSDVQKNPYSIVAFVDIKRYVYTSIFRKGNRITTSTIPEMIPFQLMVVSYYKNEHALSVTKSPSEYFGAGWMDVTNQKMMLHLYSDKDLVDEIVCLEGNDFYFSEIDKEQSEKIESYLGDSYNRKVYYRMVVTHPDFAELSLPEPVTGDFELNSIDWSMFGPLSSSGFFSDVYKRRLKNDEEKIKEKSSNK